MSPPPQPPFHFFHIDDITAAALATLQSSFRVELKMSASSTYIPKQNQGDDAHFISSENQTLGFADGVGGWARLAIDAGDYARRLMHNSILALRRQQSKHIIINPKAVLEEAYKNTNLQGSSTACIITLSGDTLRAANVGDNDNGFMIIRKGSVVFRSPTLQRCFNCRCQLGPTKDDPSVAEEMEVAVEDGDMVVAGTDGLFDNVHEKEVVEIVTRKDVEGKASYLANAALYNSFDRFGDSPFSIGSRNAGKCHSGGKIDDITVIIARIHHPYHHQEY